MNPQDLQKQIDGLRQELKNLNDEFYRDNFSAYQTFTRYSNFTSRIKVPSYAVEPTTCEVGEIIEVSGKLKICSSANTWTIVGTQT